MPSLMSVPINSFGLSTRHAWMAKSLGKNGIEEIIELPLNEEEKAKFAASAAAVRATNAALTEVGAL